VPYSTVTEVRAAILPTGGTPDPPQPPSNTAADMSNVALQDAIAEADSTIDAYIGGRYVTPVDLVAGVVPHPLDYWSRNIAAYNATLSWRKSQDFADTDPMARRYKATMAALSAVQAGKAVLPGGLPTNQGEGSSDGAGSPYEQYIGTMFEPEDFGLYPAPNRPQRGRWNWW